MRTKFILIIILIFLILSAGFYAMKVYMPDYRFGLLMAANTIMAVLSIVTYEIVRKQMNDRPAAFVRGVYASTFLKLLVCMISILLYVVLNKENLHKPSLFILFGIYAVYTTVEAILLSKLAREAK
jgi:hypothetical protein